MKRALMIAGGAVGGLGTILVVTPPQFTSSSSSLALPGGSTIPASTGGTSTTSQSTPAATQATPAATQATPAATKAATTQSAASQPTATSKATATTSSAPAATPTPTPTPTPTATKTTAAPASQGVTGSFTGDPINVGYGIVQVKITINNGKITDAQAVQAPYGRNDRFTQMAVPILRQKTLAAQGPITSGASGASYTSYGWAKSLQSALSKAGL